MTKELAIRIIEIDARIELLLSGKWQVVSSKWQVVSGDNENEIEKLKQQKIQLYEDSCNRL